MNIRHLLIAFALILLSTVLYSYSFHNPYVGIDRRVIFENEQFEGSASVVLRRVAMSPFISERGSMLQDEPLVAASFFGTLLLKGSAMSFRLPIALVHALNAVLLWWLIRMFLKEYSQHGDVLAFVAALFWLVHPLNVDAVATVAYRGIVLASFFGLAACVMRLRSSSVLARLLAFVLMILSVASSPLALMIPVVVVGALVVRERMGLREVIQQTFELWLLAFAYVVARSASGVQLMPMWSLSDGEALLRYIGLVFFPVGLHAERTLSHSSGVVEALGLLAAVGAVVGSVLLWRRGIRLASYTIALTSIVLFSVLGLLPSHAMGERWMYIPLMLISAVFVVGIPHLTIAWTGAHSKRLLRVLMVVGFVVIASLGWQTIEQQRAWRTVEGYYARVLEHEPENAQIHIDLAYSAAAEQRLDEAQHQLEVASRLDPSSSEIFLLLGNLKRNIGALDGAIEMYERSIALDDAQVFAYRNLAGIYLQRTEHAKALRLLLRLEELKPDDVAAHFAVAQLYAAAGKKKEALAALERGIPYLQSPDAAAAYEQLLRKVQ